MLVKNEETLSWWRKLPSAKINTDEILMDNVYISKHKNRKTQY